MRPNAILTNFSCNLGSGFLGYSKSMMGDSAGSPTSESVPQRLGKPATSPQRGSGSAGSVLRSRRQFRPADLGSPRAAPRARQQTGLPLPWGHLRATRSLHGGLGAPPTAMPTPRHPCSQAPSSGPARLACGRQAASTPASPQAPTDTWLLGLRLFPLRLTRDGNKPWLSVKDTERDSHTGRDQASLGRTRQGRRTAVWRGRPGRRLQSAETPGGAGRPDTWCAGPGGHVSCAEP